MRGLRSVFTRWQAMLRGLLPLAFVLGSAAAWAHSSSNAYLTLSEGQAGWLLRVDVALRDVDLQFDLDRDRDGQVVWAEVQQRVPELGAWLRQGLVWTQAGAPCQLQPQDWMASERADGMYLSAQFDVSCPQPLQGSEAGMGVRYGLIFDQDALHRGLLRIDLPGMQGSAIFSPEQPQVALSQASAWQVLGQYVREGVWHIWIGADHIAFLLSLLLLAPLQAGRQRVTEWRAVERVRPALMDVLAVVTAFTLAHSITLCLAVLEIVQLPVLWVEVAIALSVVVAALNNLLGWARRWPMAFVFGLIHGFGFANVLVDLGLPARDLAVALGSFNVGVELGQLAIVAAFFPLAWWLRHTAFYRWVIVVGASLGIAMAGLMWTLMRLGWIGD